MSAVATPYAPSTARPVVPPVRRARIDAAVRTGALVLLWLGLLLVSWWWAADGGIRDLSSWQDGLTSTGRLTGLLASVRAVPRTVASGVRLLRGSHALVALVALELLWGLGVGTYESLLPVRLADGVDPGHEPHRREQPSLEPRHRVL